jgi:hypothetical protein
MKLRRLITVSALVVAVVIGGDAAAEVQQGNVIWPPNNETNLPAELDFCNIQFPFTILVAAGTGPVLVYGQVFEAGVTEAPGPSGTLQAELGYGPYGTDPWTGSWVWVPATFNVQVGNNDEYVGGFTAPTAGTYNYTFRYSIDGGASGTYADVDGAGSNGGLTYSQLLMGVMVTDGGFSCCVGTVGNVDCSAGDGVDVGDLTALIDNLFISFTPLCCEGEANCDAAGGIDVGDLTALIDNLFINFTPLPGCN